MSDAMSDGDLLVSYTRGDEAAFASLYDRHDRKCYGFIRRLMVQSSDGVAEDVHQETWIAVAKGAASFDARRSQFVTWLFTIARNRVIDHLRAEKVSSIWTGGDADGIEDVADEAAGPLEQAMSRQFASAVVRAVEGLPFVQREAFLLFTEGEMSLEAIAKATGVGQETTKSRLRYARDGMRKHMAGWGVEHV